MKTIKIGPARNSKKKPFWMSPKAWEMWSQLDNAIEVFLANARTKR